MESRLYNVRDLHWISPNNVRNSGNVPSSKTTFVGFDTDVAQTGLVYRENRVVFSGSEAGLNYYFRPTSTFYVPTHVKVKMHASNITAKLYIDDLEIGDVGSYSNIQEVKETVIALGPVQVRKILDHRLYPKYENYSVECVGTPDLVGSSNPVAVYGIELSLIGTGTYQNYISNTVYSPIKLLPTGVFTTNVSWKNHDNSFLNVERFNSSPTGVNVNSTYVQAQNEPLIHEGLPSGFLSVMFDSNTNQTVNVNRAILSFNMSLPVSGSRGNYRDKIDVYGKSRTYSYGFESLINDEFINPVGGGGPGSEPIGSEPSSEPYSNPTGLHPFSSILWGHTDIIENSGFINYNVDLVFLDPERLLNPVNSGNTSSRKFAHLAAMQDLELKFVGVPSGAQLSAMELTLETQNTNSANLFVDGVYKENKQADLVVIGAPQKITSFTDLLTSASSSINNSKNLFTKSAYVINQDLNLYNFGVFKINNGFPEYDSGEFEGAWGLEDNIPQLYVLGHETENNNVNLFLKTAERDENNLNLYLGSKINSSSSADLFINSFARQNSNFNLFVSGSESANSLMNLFIRGSIPNKVSESVNMVIRSSLNNSLFVSNNLFLKSIDYDNNNYMPLFLSNNNTDSYHDSLNLFIGQKQNALNTVPLYVFNSSKTLNSAKKLFLKGANNYKTNASMDLYISRDYEALGHSLTMFMSTVDGINSSTPLVIKSANIKNSNDYDAGEYDGAWMLSDIFPNDITIIIRGIDYPKTNSNLFISGF